MRSSSRVLVGGLALLAVLVAATWWSVRSGSADRAGATTAPTRLAARAEHADTVLAQPGPADPERAVTNLDFADVGESAAAPASDAQRARTGTLVVRVVDAATGTVLPDVALRVTRERGGARLLGTGVTDEHGEARFETVEANTLIVEAQRRPPYARAFGAAWLEAGETETVVVAMGPGSMVRGRVVDDAGAPLAGAVVRVNDDFTTWFGAAVGAPNSDAPEAAKTLADGRFEFAALAPRPIQVWIEHGAMAPRSWSPPGVVVRFEDGQEYASPSSETATWNAIEDLGDVVIPRARTWSGRVVDGRGAPIEGALVSTHWDRMWAREIDAPANRRDAIGWPGAPNLLVREAECRSDGAGGFELRGRPQNPSVVVWTPSGLVRTFDLPEVEPGGRADGVELRVDDALLLVIELVDGDGRRISTPHERNRGVTRPGSRSFFGTELALTVRGASIDTSKELVSDSDGLFRVQLDDAARGAAVVRLEMPGYVAVTRDVEIGSGAPVRVELEALPVLRLRVRFEGAERADAGKPRHVRLHACIADPTLQRTPEMRAWVDEPCCGLGAVRSLQIAAAATDVELPVLADRPFFLGLREPGSAWSRTFGPWRPGETVYEDVVPELPVPPERESLVARIRARVTDARTDEPILAFVHFADPGEAADIWQTMGVRFAVIEPRAKGPSDAPVGRWRMSVRSEGYRSPPARVIELAADSEQDLGTFALEPLPVVAVALVGADPAAVRVDVLGADGSWIGSSELADGALRLRADVPSRGVASISESSEAIGERSQCVEFEYDGGGRLALQLAPWRAVEVRCPVAGPDQLAAQLQVQLVDARFPARGRFAQQSLVERAADSYSRRFTGWCAAGAHLLRSQSLLLGNSETRVEVPPSGDGAIRLELPRAR